MNAFEEFFRKPPEERATEGLKTRKAPRPLKPTRAPDAPLGFTEAVRDLSVFMRRAAEREWTEWLELTEEKRVGRLVRNKIFGIHRNPETQRKKQQRKRLMQKLRDKQIFARLQRVGMEGLDEEDRVALEHAKSRQRRKARKRGRDIQKQETHSGGIGDAL